MKRKRGALGRRKSEREGALSSKRTIESLVDLKRVINGKLPCRGFSMGCL